MHHCLLISNQSGRSPLFYCAQSGELDMCKLLLDCGADINLKDHFGRFVIELY